jgi:hypothetical protein
VVGCPTLKALASLVTVFASAPCSLRIGSQGGSDASSSGSGPGSKQYFEIITALSRIEQNQVDIRHRLV